MCANVGHPGLNDASRSCTFSNQPSFAGITPVAHFKASNFYSQIYVIVLNTCCPRGLRLVQSIQQVCWKIQELRCWNWIVRTSDIKLKSVINGNIGPCCLQSSVWITCVRNSDKRLRMESRALIRQCQNEFWYAKQPNQTFWCKLVW